MKKPTDKKVILASASPRRRQLLATIIPDFKQAPVRKIEEIYPPNLPAGEVAGYLSHLKANAYKDLIDENTLVIAADTVVLDNGHILGKPQNTEMAVKMIESLAGHTHSVITGVTIAAADRTETFAATTEVTFSPLDREEIEHYVTQFKPFDKAGAYGIQEWIGYAAVTAIKGCFYNVMGLPVQKLYDALKNF